MPTTRLSAIIFTDIVGYTAMMQGDRTKAMTAVKQFEAVLRDRIAVHGGELLQTYGDGSLSTFPSASAAVQCAKEIQEQIRDQVPLRIGIHLGEITRDGDHIFGDGVNLASRVESMGVSGAVLLSSSVRQQIKNRPEFELTSLGKFAFKNVAEPMTVYALANEGFAVPEVKNMEGKGKKITDKSFPKFPIRMALIGFVAMAVGAGLFWAFGLRNPGSAQLLSQDIRKGKVAVAVFENFTNDPELNTLGYLASEWITSSLREIGIKTVSPEMVRQYKDYIGIFANDPEGRVPFSDISGAHYLISGSYFPQGDSLRLNTRLLNAETGEEIQQFPVLWAQKSEKENLVEEARQRLMGYWAIEKNQHFPKVRPPKYEAYQKYLECIGGDFFCYLEALEIDSTFLLAHAGVMYNTVWGQQEEIHFRARNYLDRHKSFLTEYEQNYYLFGKYFWEGQDDKAFEALDRNYQLDSMDIWMLHETAYFVSSHLNRPDIAVDRYRFLFSNYDIFRDHVWPNNFYHYTDALNRMGKHQEVISFAKSLPDKDWLDKGAWDQLFLAYLEINEPDIAIQWVDSVFRLQNDPIVLSNAAYIWSAIYQDSIPNPFHQRIRQNLDSFYPISDAGIWDLFDMYASVGVFRVKEYQAYLLGDWAEAESKFLNLRGKTFRFVRPGEESLEIFTHFSHPIFSLWVEAMLGFIYAHQDKAELALQQVEKLSLMQPELPTPRTPLLRGLVPYYQAKIHALLGDKDKAVNLLRISRAEGRPIIWSNFTLDWELASLRGYEPYEALIRPAEK